MGVSFLQTPPSPASHSDTSPPLPTPPIALPPAGAGFGAGAMAEPAALRPPRPAQGLIWGQHHLFLAFHINATDSSPRQEIPDIKLIPAMLTASPGPAPTSLGQLRLGGKPPPSAPNIPHTPPSPLRPHKGHPTEGLGGSRLCRQRCSGPCTQQGDSKDSPAPTTIPTSPPHARQGPPPPNRGDPKVLGEPQLLGAPLHPTPEEVLLHPAG